MSFEECRCVECRKANLDWCQQARERREQGMPPRSAQGLGAMAAHSARNALIEAHPQEYADLLAAARVELGLDA